jgi:hypothetical protein
MTLEASHSNRRIMLTFPLSMVRKVKCPRRESKLTGQNVNVDLIEALPPPTTCKVLAVSLELEHIPLHSRSVRIRGASTKRGGSPSVFGIGGVQAHMVTLVATAPFRLLRKLAEIAQRVPRARRTCAHSGVKGKSKSLEYDTRPEKPRIQKRDTQAKRARQHSTHNR